jgi:hypothetical protein
MQRRDSHNALEYAVERKLLAVNPITTVKWKAPRTTHEVDRRCVVNHRQARLLLDAVDRRLPSGPRIMAFEGASRRLRRWPAATPD